MRPGEAHPPATAEGLLCGWGRTTATRARIVRPRDPEEVRAGLRAAPPRGVVARGLGRSYGDAAQNAGGDVLLTTGLDRIGALDGERGRVRVAAGVSLGALTRALLPHGWLPPVTPGTQHVTVGGAIASDVHGKSHHRDGSFCRHVLGMEVVLASGERRTLTPEATPEAFWATAGGMGLTGVVVEAELALRRVETAAMVVETTRTRNLDETMAALADADARWHHTVAWLDLLAGGPRSGRGVVTGGDHATRAALGPLRRTDPLRLREPRWVPTAPPVPGRRGVLSPALVRALNEAHHRAAPRRPATGVESLPSFLYPLDGVRAWNRCYGRAGLVQYQLVVPDGAETELRRMIEALTSARVPAYLAVLKRLGPSGGPLTFPIRGWTLALDFPAAAAGLAEALDRLDEAVAGCGGRVYLAKDARLRPELVPAMYPELARWREARDRLDPGRAMRSDLARRLALVDADGKGNG